MCGALEDHLLILYGLLEEQIRWRWCFHGESSLIKVVEVYELFSLDDLITDLQPMNYDRSIAKSSN